MGSAPLRLASKPFKRKEKKGKETEE